MLGTDTSGSCPPLHAPPCRSALTYHCSADQPNLQLWLLHFATYRRLSLRARLATSWQPGMPLAQSLITDWQEYKYPSSLCPHWDQSAARALPCLPVWSLGLSSVAHTSGDLHFPYSPPVFFHCQRNLLCWNPCFGDCFWRAQTKAAHKNYV